MTNYFEFKENNQTTFIAYSGEELITIIINFDNNHNNNDWLLDRLTCGDFERWLKDIGEIKSYNFILGIKNNVDIINNYLLSPEEKIKRFKKKLIYRKYFQYIDIKQVIEIKLKEYEALRAEILFHMENRTQVIILGLSAIFVIAGLALTPLTEIYKTITEGNTIINQAIIPSVVILAVFIPIASLYITLRIIDSTKTIIEINKYISNKIEKKINQLLKDKLKFDISLSKKYKLSWRKYMYWETYVKSKIRSKKSKFNRTFNYNTIMPIIIFLFLILGLLSLLSSLFLLSWDFNYSEFYFNRVGIKFFVLWLIILLLFVLWRRKDFFL